MRLNTMMRITPVAILLASVGAQGEMLHEQDDITLEGTAQVVVRGAGRCQIKSGHHLQGEYERIVENHGQPLHVWRIDFVARNGSKRHLRYLTVHLTIASDWPPCTTWSWPEGKFNKPVQWASSFHKLEKSDGMKPGEVVSDTIFVLAFDGQEPVFKNWLFDYDFVAKPGTEPSPSAATTGSAKLRTPDGTLSNTEDVFEVLRARVTGGAIFSNGRAVFVKDDDGSNPRFESPQFGQASSYLAFETQPSVWKPENSSFSLDSIANVRLTTIPVKGPASSGPTEISLPAASILQSQKAVQVQLGVFPNWRFPIGNESGLWTVGPVYRAMFQSVTDQQRTLRVWNIEDDLYDAHVLGLRLALNKQSDDSWMPTASIDISFGKFQNFVDVEGLNEESKNCLQMPNTCVKMPPPETAFNVDKTLRTYVEGRVFFKSMYFGFDLNNGDGYDDLRLVGGATVPLSTFFSNQD